MFAGGTKWSKPAGEKWRRGGGKCSHRIGKSGAPRSPDTPKGFIQLKTRLGEEEENNITT